MRDSVIGDIPPIKSGLNVIIDKINKKSFYNVIFYVLLSNISCTYLKLIKKKHQIYIQKNYY
jgi:hypothetical protein